MDDLLEEVEAIDAIYPDCMVQRSTGLYDLTIPDRNIRVQLSFSSSYPSQCPHLLSIVGHESKHVEELLKDILNSVFIPDQVCIFDFLEAARDVLEAAPEIEQDYNNVDSSNIDVNHDLLNQDIFEGWSCSEPIIDRKSLFIARATEAHSTEEARDKIDKLKLDKRIGRASHNMTAWRIKKENGVIIQDCDDDGETAAGGRLLHLLQLTNSWNVAIFVSRWYGGILLGPDR